MENKPNETTEVAFSHSTRYDFENNKQLKDMSVLDKNIDSKMGVLKEISEEFKKKEIPFEFTIDTNKADYLKNREYFYCFTLSTMFWNKLSSSRAWINFVKTEHSDLNIEDCNNKIQVGVFAETEEESNKVKEKMGKALSDFFIENNFLDFFQGGISIKGEEYPDADKIENYKKREKELYQIAQKGLESATNFKVLLLGNTGTGKSFFSQIMSKHLVQNKFVDCSVWGTLVTVSEILQLKKKFELNIKILFVVDELEMDSVSRDKESSTSMVIKFFDSFESLKDIKFIGISNVPELIDKAIYRPGRIDMMIFSSHTKMSEESILNIIKSINKEKNIKDSDLKKLASLMFEKYKGSAMPNSFYSLGLKLFKMYGKDLKIVEKILNEFYRKKDLYNFKNEKFNSEPRMGFGNDSPDDDEDED